MARHPTGMWLICGREGPFKKVRPYPGVRTGSFYKLQNEVVPPLPGRGHRIKIQGWNCDGQPSLTHVTRETVVCPSGFVTHLAAVLSGKFPADCVTPELFGGSHLDICMVCSEREENIQGWRPSLFVRLGLCEGTNDGLKCVLNHVLKGLSFPP